MNNASKTKLTAAQRKAIFKRVPDDLKFNIGARLPIDGEYTAVDKYGSSNKRTKALPLGRGNAGLVYRAEYKGRLSRVVKFLAPDPEGDEQAELGMLKLSEYFLREISLLSKACDS